MNRIESFAKLIFELLGGLKGIEADPVGWPNAAALASIRLGLTGEEIDILAGPNGPLWQVIERAHAQRGMN